MDRRTQQADAVRRCFTAYACKDRPMIEALLREDFTFTSPYDDHINRAAYFECCWPNADKIRCHDIETLVGQDDEVFVLYRCETVDGRAFRNVERFRFENGGIKSIEVYFGRTA